MYVPVMRYWLRRIFYHPGSWMKISGIFILCALPVFTVGWAWGIAIELGRRDTEERRLQCFRTVREGFCKRGLLFFIMGILDLCIAFLLAASVVTLIGASVPLIAKAASALFFWLDSILLCSGMYRYPLAVYEEGFSFS
ncbi:MAG: hypothetical protein LBQ88_01365, partial [Treponema sp.]|nr:hypothetical protein [Treponema sp.]